MASADKPSLGEAIAETCLAAFAKLGKTGKPNQPFEWTLLAGVVATSDEGATIGKKYFPLQGEDHQVSRFSTIELTDADPTPKLLTLGTGTKCLGATKVPHDGSLVLDSHAEVIAVRTLRRSVGFSLFDMRFPLRKSIRIQFGYSRLRWVHNCGHFVLSWVFKIPKNIKWVPGRHLLEGIQADLAGRDSSDGTILVRVSDKPGRYRLRPGVQLHLYVSQTPCMRLCVNPHCSMRYV
jgi:hypothetical protein